jgi:hypothetical protein
MLSFLTTRGAERSRVMAPARVTAISVAIGGESEDGSKHPELVRVFVWHTCGALVSHAACRFWRASPQRRRRASHRAEPHVGGSGAALGGSRPGFSAAGSFRNWREQWGPESEHPQPLPGAPGGRSRACHGLVVPSSRVPPLCRCRPKSGSILGIPRRSAPAPHYRRHPGSTPACSFGIPPPTGAASSGILSAV